MSKKVNSTHSLINYTIPKAFLDRMAHALQDTIDTRVLPTETICLLDDSEGIESTQFVATVSGASEVRGFSAANISSFKAFHQIKTLHKSYTADMNWLMKDGDAKYPLLPHANRLLRARGSDCTGDVSLGARASICAVLSNCAHNTRFRIRTSDPHLQMTIAVSDIVGFLGRTAQLNDAVLMYALRQMASDYEGVFVFDCQQLRTPRSCLVVPGTHVTSYHTMLFPVLYGEAHLCIVCVRLRHGSVVDVGIYDSLQGAYDNANRETWKSKCIPMLTCWLTRDGLPVPEDLASHTVRVLVTQRQFDGDSCGVYCFAVAIDYFGGGDYYMQLGPADEDSEPNDSDENTDAWRSAACQLRVRMMWRIFCHSYRFDFEDEEQRAKQTIAAFTSSQLDE